MFENRIVVVVGGTGSFGSAFVKKIMQTNVAEIRIFSRDEKKQQDLRYLLDCSKLKFYVGDVRDFDSVDNVMYGADFVFHAAALKQVPSCEFFPEQAIKTNIIGAENTLKAAVKNKVSRIVLLSTDKAVYPINTMGMTKAIMEKLMIAKSRMFNSNQITMCATRYGNVIGSRGSVIPLFIKQIKEKKPITITNPNMTRFLMSLEDSVNLVLYALENAKPGDIFVHKAPAILIKDLAQTLKELFSSNVDIKYIGTRHGEKLFESLISSEEMLKVEDLGSYYRISADNGDLNYSNFFDSGNIILNNIDDYNSHNVHRLSIQESKNFLLNIEYIKEELNA